MGFVYFEQLYIYCPNSFLNYFSEPFEIIRQGGWIFKEAGRNENLKLIIIIWTKFLLQLTEKKEDFFGFQLFAPYAVYCCRGKFFFGIIYYL